jgi:hypothetical protein
MVRTQILPITIPGPAAPLAFHGFFTKWISFPVVLHTDCPSKFLQLGKVFSPVSPFGMILEKVTVCVVLAGAFRPIQLAETLREEFQSLGAGLIP